MKINSNNNHNNNNSWIKKFNKMLKKAKLLLKLKINNKNNRNNLIKRIYKK